VAIREILFYPDPILNQATVPVTQFGRFVESLVENLADTIYATTGVGLAAPQIGSNKSVLIIDPFREDGKRKFKALINPKLISKEGEQLSKDEGCKSLPGLRVDVPRAAKVVIEGQDIKGNPIRIEASGFEAIVLQHELDHLDGVLTIDHISQEDRERQGWYARNLSQVFRRMNGLSKKPDSVLFRRRTREKNTFIIKDGFQIQLYFATSDLDTTEIRLSGIMSRIDVRDPLVLLGIYTQAMMLSLVWKTDPAKIYMLGFGGGRIPLIFYHYFPEVIIDGAELDPDVIEYATRYFGIRLDERLKVTPTDGRAHLAGMPGDLRYDIILIDCYTGTGDHPYQLSTVDFYEICKSHLTANGVVATNLIENDPLFEAKRDTFQSSFEYTYDFTHDGAHVFFGTSNLISEEEFFERACKADETYKFHFPFVERARTVRRLPSLNIGPKSILTDSRPPAGIILNQSQEPLFRGVGRNDQCPCGSGKKYKKCHGAI
jgi:peptide deformylase